MKLIKVNEECVNKKNYIYKMKKNLKKKRN